MKMNFDQQVTIRDFRLVPVVGIDILPGSFGADSVAHMRLADIPNETAYYVPLSRAALQGLAGMIERALEAAPEPPDAEIE